MVKKEDDMSEFIAYPVEQSLGEVIGEAYDRVRTFVGDMVTRTEVMPDELEALTVQSEAVTSDQQPQNTPGQPQPETPHVCGASCSKCGHGGSQVKKPGLRR